MFYILYLNFNNKFSILCNIVNFKSTEPNNDSPLNGDAAALWPNQETYKSVLLEKYEKDVRSKQS